MVRIYVRNKGRYDPKTAENPLPFVDVDNPGDVLIKHVRETVKRRINCKLDELYYNNQLLDEDRSVAYSNLQDGTVLESCSNPFWAACMYVRLRAVEQEAANNPTDQKKQRWTHQSILNRAAALGVLFNSNSFERHQPPHLPTLQDLWTCLQTNGRKPVHMSEFTRTALQELQEEFQNIDVHRRDPLASFVHRHAVKLGFRDPNAPEPGDGPVHAGPGNGVPATQAAGARGNNNNNRNGGRRRQNRPRPCDDCEAEDATKYCAQCEGGLVLCQPCCDRLHQGRARRHHNIQGIEEAPKAAKSYTPKAYKAPFAMLVALFKGLSQVPQVMSMTADEIKSRAQVFTDTDLSDRAAGKFFGGFDNMQNTLQINGFVQREAGENARFSLLQPGRTLAQKCTEFHQAVEDLLNVNRVPKVPQLGGTQCGPRRVCLLVDSKEPLCERMAALAHRQGVAAQVRDLPVGDFLWILLPPAAGVDYAAVRPDDEQVLPHIVERKTWDDLQNSLSTRRFRNQVEAMKRCGLRDLFYLVEGHPSDMRTRPSKEQIQYYENQLLNLEMKDGFLVNRTGTWLKTAQWLLQLTAMAAHMQNTGTNGRLITYAEYSTRASSKNRGVPEPRPRPDYLGVHTWSADKLVDMVFRQYHNEANFSDAAKTDLQDVPPTQRSPGSRPLLIIQDLEVYNKNSQKFKDRALAEYLNQQAGNRTVREIVDTMLGASVRELIHFDVFCYWQLWLQVHLGCHVKRTEAPEETQRLQNLYRQHRNDAGPNQPLFMDNFLNHNDEDEDDDDEDGRGGAPPVQRGRGRRVQGRGRGRGNNRRGTVRPQLPPNNRRVAGSATAGRRKPSQGRKQDHPSNDPPMPTLGPDVAGTVNERMEVDEGRRLGSLSTDDFAPDSQNEDLMIQQALELSKADSLPAARKNSDKDRTEDDFAPDSQNEDLMIQQALELSKADYLPAARNYGDEDRTDDDFASDSQNEDLMIQQALELSKADSLPAARNESNEDRREDANRDEEDQLAEALRLSLMEHEKQTSAMQEHGAIPDKPQGFSENISKNIAKQQDFENIATDESLDKTEPIEIIDSQDVNETIAETEGSSNKDASLEEPIEIIDSQDTVVEEKDSPIEVSNDSQNTSIEAVKDTGADDPTRSSSDTQEEELLSAVSAKKDSLLPTESNSEKTLYSRKRDINPCNSFAVENSNTHESAVGTESDVSNPTSSEISSDFMQSNREGEARLEEMQQRSEEDKMLPVGMPQESTSEHGQDAMPFDSNVELNDQTLTNSSIESSSDSKEKEDSSAENVEVDPDLALAIRLSQEEAKMARKRSGQIDKRVTRSKAKSNTSCSSPSATNTQDKADSSAIKKEDGPTLETQTSAASGEIDPDLALALKLSEEEFIASQKKDEQMIREKSLQSKSRNNDTGTDGKVLESFSKNKTLDRNASGQINSNFSPRAICNDQVLPDVQQNDEPFSFVENSVKEEEFIEENFGPVLQTSRHDRDSPEDNEMKLKELAASLSGNTNTRDLQESLQDSQDFESQTEDTDKDLCLALKLSEKEISSTTTLARVCDRKNLPTKQTSQKDNNPNQDLQKDFELAVRVAFQEKVDCEDHSCSKLKEIDTSRVKEEETVEEHGNDEDLELARKIHEDLNRDVLQSEHKKSTEAVKVLGGVQSSTAKRKLNLHYEKDLELAKQLEAELNRKPADVENSAKRIKVDPDYEKDLALARQLERDKISSQTQYEKDLELARKLSEELNSNGSGSKSNSSGFGSPGSKGKLPHTGGSPGTSEGPAVFRERRREREKSAQQLEDYRRLQAQHYRTSAVGATASSSKSTPVSTPQRQSQHATGRSAAEIFTMDDDDDDLPDIPPRIQLHDANPGTSNATWTSPTHVQPSSSPASASRPSTSTSDGMSTSDGGDTGTCSGTSTSTADGPGTSTPRQNTKCGACGQHGHNRTSKRCPRYFCQEEVKRRQAQAERRQAKAEAEERDFRSKLGRLEREREESARVRSQLRRQFEEMDRRMREREEDAQAVIQHLDKGRKKRKK